MYIEPKNDVGAYDREVFLTLKEFEPFFSRGGDAASHFLPTTGVDSRLKARGEAAMKASLAKGMPHGYEVGYRLFTINGKMLVHGQRVRIKRGERVLFHVLNAGATGKPQWRKPPQALWDYRHFARPGEIIDLAFGKNNASYHGFNLWTVNGQPYDWKTKPITRSLDRGKRYRLRMRNISDDIHPIHLHRNSFEITRFAGQPTAGVVKDVAMLGGYQRMDVDFVARHPGLTLFHCHQQLHMDYGFMVLFDVA